MPESGNSENEPVSSQRRLDWWLFLILFSALLIRLLYLGHTPAFYKAEAEAALGVEDLLRGEMDLSSFTPHFRLTPVASHLYYYLILPFAWLGGISPFILRFSTVFFSLTGIWLVFLIGGELFGKEKKTRFYAPVILAFLPADICFSRVVDQMSLLPFFAALVLFLALRWYRRREKKTLFWLGLISGLGLSLHLIFLYFLLALGTAFFFLPERPRMGRREAEFFVAGLIPGIIPILMANLRSGWQTFSYLAANLPVSHAGLNNLDFFQNLKGRFLQTFSFLDGSAVFFHFTGERFTLLPLVLPVLWLLSLAFALLQGRTLKNSLGPFILVLNLFLLFELCFSPSMLNQTHLLLLLIPALLAFSSLLERLPGRFLAFFLVGFLSLLNVFSLQKSYFEAYQRTGGIPRAWFFSPGVLETSDTFLSGLDEAERYLEKNDIKRVYAGSSSIEYPLTYWSKRKLSPVVLSVQMEETLSFPLRQQDTAFIFYAMDPEKEPWSKLGKNEHVGLDKTELFLGLLRKRGESELPRRIIRGADGTPHYVIY
ncbi:MAG: glycosyltransferase family 39 protein [bacterium]